MQLFNSSYRSSYNFVRVVAYVSDVLTEKMPVSDFIFCFDDGG